ncbi:MAG: sporulation protein YunB [Defluviitaleaceae bacterium]|nr:sporulation protein YunB [Defluviitaleaceae bacterium]
MKKWRILISRWLRRRGRKSVHFSYPVARESSTSRSSTATLRSLPSHGGSIAYTDRGLLRTSRTSRSRFRIPRKYPFMLMLAIVVVSFVYSYYRFDRAILPIVLEAAELSLQTEINNVINRVISEIIRDRGITAGDFYMQHYDAAAGAPTLSVNTVLINDISNEAALRISLYLNTMEPEVASIPMGMLLGLDTLSQVGPRFNFTMAPIGNALVTHDSQFFAVGINQTHFSIGLNIEAIVRIINPVHSFEVAVDRHITLVNTVITGVVPDTYLILDIAP